jgi:hypothetical protein
MIGRDPDQDCGIGRMNLCVPDPQLELPLVVLWATVQKFCAKHVLIPLSGPRSIADLDVDMVDQCDSGHCMTSCHIVWVRLSVMILHKPTPRPTAPRSDSMAVSGTVT